MTRFKRDVVEINDEFCDEIFNPTVVIGEKYLYEQLKTHELLETKSLIWQPLKEKDRPLSTPPLHIAVQEGDRAAIEACLRNGADINESDSTGSTALHIAIEKNDFELFTYLLSKKPLLALCNGKNKTPLSLAASLDTEGRMIESLIAAGAKLNDRGIRPPL